MTPTHDFPAGFPAQSLEQLPPTQHVSLHDEVAEQVDVHVWVDVSHAFPNGQSLGALQPQVPPDRHALPDARPVQLVHVPLAPHAPLSVPVAHTPALEQQPVGHGFDAPHGAPQRCVDVSHTCPLGQSVVALQPHAPPTHA